MLRTFLSLLLLSQQSYSFDESLPPITPLPDSGDEYNPDPILFDASACSAGSTPSGTTCTLCTAGSFSASGVSCIQCSAGGYASGDGAAVCVSCSAGSFSYFASSTMCTQCPSQTGSVTGSSACVACSTSGCRMGSDSVTPCPSCSGSCTPCAAGLWNDGNTAHCVGCSAGTYSTLTQATSAGSCVTCGVGSTTLPTDAGRTSCSDCGSLNQPLPPQSTSVPSTVSPLICSWSCSAGYVLQNASETLLSIYTTTYLSQGFSPPIIPTLFHSNVDYCCTSSGVPVGFYLSGCSRASTGTVMPCVAIANRVYIDSLVPSTNRCNDWTCAYGWYKNGGNCVAQQSCGAGSTWTRDVNGNLLATSSGAFVCVACSVCMDGSEPIIGCNKTADTTCRLCAPTWYSSSGRVCIPSPPLGQMPVIVQLVSLPPFQGRPTVYSNAAAINWGSVDFAHGFFINTYTPCQPLASAALQFTGADTPCQKKSYDSAGCVSPVCATQCAPWNGSVGFYSDGSGGGCAECVYDGTMCSGTQFLDMTACGPTSPPVCRSCPTTLLPNSLGWTNPLSMMISGPYPCDYVCRSGFSKYNFSCISCPTIPDNAKIVSACNWTCSLGFMLFNNNTQCTPCPSITSCGVGQYSGFAPDAQCAGCLNCTNLVLNAQFTSSGVHNDPMSCSFVCNSQYFYTPPLDSNGNPSFCSQCSTLQCPSTSFKLP